MDTLLQEVPFESIPQCLGGGFKLYNEQYFFDYSETGALYYPGCPEPPPGLAERPPPTTVHVEGPSRRVLRCSNVLKADVAPAEGPTIVPTRRPSTNTAPHATNSSSSNINPLQIADTERGRCCARAVRAAGRELRLLRENLSVALRGAPAFSLLVASILTIVAATHGSVLLSLVLPVVPMYLAIALLFGEV
jgi:hypothetical protein